MGLQAGSGFYSWQKLPPRPVLAPFMLAAIKPRLRCPATEIKPCQTVRFLSMSASTTDTARTANSQAAFMQTILAIAAATSFCSAILVSRGLEAASAWLAAYVLEESLSVDNLFVFSLIFDYFKTPTYAQPRVLKLGLLAAIFLRGAFVIAGLAVVESFKGMLLLFSAVLLFSAYSILTGSDDGEEDLSQNAIVTTTQESVPPLAQRRLPFLTSFLSRHLLRLDSRVRA